MLGAGGDRQDQLGSLGRRGILIVDDGKRQRAVLARHLRGIHQVGAASGLRDNDKQGIAHFRRPAIGRHDGRRGGGCEKAKPRFEKITQIHADMARTAAPAEHDDARLGSLDPLGDCRDHVGARQKTLGRRRNFGGLAPHCAAGVRFSHRRP